jgi:hypothetical protein
MFSLNKNHKLDSRLFFVNSEQLQTPGMDSKVRVVVAVTTLLLGPLDIGSSIIG